MLKNYDKVSMSEIKFNDIEHLASILNLMLTGKGWHISSTKIEYEKQHSIHKITISMTRDSIPDDKETPLLIIKEYDNYSVILNYAANNEKTLLDIMDTWAQIFDD